MEALNIQLMLYEMIQQVPDWYDFVDDGTHGILSIVMGVAVAVYIGTKLFAVSTMGGDQ